MENIQQKFIVSNVNIICRGMFKDNNCPKLQCDVGRAKLLQVGVNLDIVAHISTGIIVCWLIFLLSLVSQTVASQA